MNQERLINVLLAPVVSEKSTILTEKQNQFVFRVLKDATKTEIKQAVEKMFDVKVKAVQVAIMKGKTRTFGGIKGRRKDWKKAFVALQEGHDINLVGNKA